MIKDIHPKYLFLSDFVAVASAVHANRNVKIQVLSCRIQVALNSHYEK